MLVMEEDGSTTEQVQNVLSGVLGIAGGVAAATGVTAAAAPFLIGAGDLMALLTKSGLYLKNTDDYIGSFKMQIVNSTGIPQISFAPIGRVTNTKTWDNGLVEYWMNGDGSEYDIIMNYEGT